MGKRLHHVMKAISISGIALLAIGFSNMPEAIATSHTDLRGQQTDLNIIWEVTPSGQDKMSTTSRSEASMFSMNGQLYYVPKASGTNQKQLYRLYNGTSDHMDSLSTGEGGYTLENTLGYPWNGAANPAGTQSMFRGLDSSTGDHALMSRYFTFSGYSNEGFTDTYAYPRFGNVVNLYSLTGSALTIKSNLAAGGSIWEYWWNGKQYIDHLDYGREIQSSLSFTDSDALPTEGGDSTASSDRNNMHGSPIASYSNSIGATSKTQSTRAIPLEWNFQKYNGGLADNPVIYKNWKLGKDITIDDTSLNLGSSYSYLQGQIARYNTVISTPITLTNADIEIPTAYLLPEFKRAFTFNATVADINTAAHEVSNSEFGNIAPGTYHYQYNVSSGGVIYANAGLDHAIGLYGSTPAAGGSAKYFTLWKFGSSIASPSVTKLSAGAGITTINAGTDTFTTYLIAGTYDDVRVAMRRLYLGGYR